MKKDAAPIIAVMVLLLLMLYVGSYCAMVVPFWGAAYYRFGGRVSAQIFWPLEQVDRKVRPATWQGGWWSAPVPSMQAFHCPTHWPTEQHDPPAALEEQ